MEIRIIHFLFLLGLTISHGVAQNFNLPTASSQPYTIGGTRVTFTGLSLGNDLTKLKCTVHIEGTDAIPVDAVTLADHKTVYCRLPLRVSSGKVGVEFEYQNDQNVTDTLSKSILLVPEPRPEILVDEDWENTDSKIEFKWDPNFFKTHYNVSSILLEYTILVSEEGTPIFVETGIRMVIGLNDLGTARPPVPDTVSRQIAEFRHPYFYVVSATGRPDIFQTSNLLTPTLGKEPDTAKDICNNWLLTATAPAPEQITPCPNCLCKAKIDPHFIPDEYDLQIVKLAAGRLAGHQLYRQRVPTGNGHAQTCSYKVATTELATNSPVESGWHHYVSKDVNYVENYLSDIWPYIVCCIQTESDGHCNLFHDKRPKNTGHTYPGPDDPCQGTGDPHMITFDGVRYDFMGYGEFWLIHGPGSAEGTFGIQGRMAPNTPNQKVSYYKAIAARDGNTTVQIQHNAQGGVQILVNGDTQLAIPASPTTIPLGAISLSVNGPTVEVRLRTGFTVKVQSMPAWGFHVYGSGLLQNKGKGYMGIFGNFDGNITNDLTNREGFVIEPTTENIRNLTLLHNTFGLSWMTKPEESFFVYEDGFGWEKYTNISFGPIPSYPDPSTMPDDVRAICKENLACYYEFVGTGSLKDAEDTVVADEDLEKLKEENNEKVLMCDVIPPPPNGKVAVEGYMNGSVATYSCRDEYDVEGEATRTCAVTEDGEVAWDGQEPVCLWTCVRCTEDVEYLLTPDPSDCNKFFACSFGIRYPLYCPEGELFNPEFGVCDKIYVCPGDPPGCQ